jgi:hypothetical protein
LTMQVVEGAAGVVAISPRQDLPASRLAGQQASSSDLGEGAKAGGPVAVAGVAVPSSRRA